MRVSNHCSLGQLHSRHKNGRFISKSKKREAFPRPPPPEGCDARPPPTPSHSFWKGQGRQGGGRDRATPTATASQGCMRVRGQRGGMRVGGTGQMERKSYGGARGASIQRRSREEPPASPSHTESSQGRSNTLLLRGDPSAPRGMHRGEALPGTGQEAPLRTAAGSRQAHLLHQQGRDTEPQLSPRILAHSLRVPGIQAEKRGPQGAGLRGRPRAEGRNLTSPRAGWGARAGRGKDI